MRCKPGDLAVMCGSITTPENVGIFLRVTELDPFDRMWRFEDASRPVQFYIGKKKCECFRSSAEAGGNAWIPDRELRPIRPGDGADETLVWAGRPERVEA